jgi:hypothetical protein
MRELGWPKRRQRHWRCASERLKSQACEGRSSARRGERERKNAAPTGTIERALPLKRAYPMTTRRQALRQLALLASPSGLPLALAADAPKRIGILSEASAEASKDTLIWEPDVWGLMSQRGWIVGQNVVVERAFAETKSNRLPRLAVVEFVQAGGLLSYAVPDSEVQLLTVRWIEYIDRVLRGAKPADMPVIGADRYELQINMKTAETLGLTIPQSILSRADGLVR